MFLAIFILMFYSFPIADSETFPIMVLPTYSFQLGIQFL